MTNQQSAPEALRLADELAQRWGENMVCSELEAAAELRRLHYENAWLAALVEAQQAAPSAADRVKLPEPDTAETAPWTGWKVKYHSPDQIIGYGNQQFNAGRQFEAERLAALRAQQPTTHVQNPAEIEHVAGDVSKNGPGSNMAQPAPSAAAAVGEVEPVFWMNEKGHTWSHSDWKQFPKHRAKYPIPLYAHRPASPALPHAPGRQRPSRSRAAHRAPAHRP
ncbi:hypothetical protein [Acidovorax sp. KKS102]|uniref:hypothetical protein n=1 Tax=Acidovorax sp. KKS102 TaxID=358220 RepID=UPI0011D22483|nr:hypothetical protein [Acidovorax sp. KKS102]